MPITAEDSMKLDHKIAARLETTSRTTAGARVSRARVSAFPPTLHSQQLCDR